MAVSGEILAAIASQNTLEEVQTTIGDTGDTGGSTTAGSVMGKLNQLVGSAGLSGFQEFTTPGAFSFTVPAGVTLVSLTACGGGGGGGSGYTDQGGGGGGGGAAVFGKKISVSPGQIIKGTVGSGGTGAEYNRDNGTNGGTTTISGVISLPGGGKGDLRPFSGTYYGAPGGEGGGMGGCGSGKLSNGEYIVATPGFSGVMGAGGGCVGIYSASSGALGGGGGGGSLGIGGIGGNYATGNGGAGTKGGGGGGGKANSNGGNGGNGYVKFSWGVCMD